MLLLTLKSWRLFYLLSSSNHLKINDYAYTLFTETIEANHPPRLLKACLAKSLSLETMAAKIIISWRPSYGCIKKNRPADRPRGCSGLVWLRAVASPRQQNDRAPAMNVVDMTIEKKMERPDWRVRLFFYLPCNVFIARLMLWLSKERNCCRFNFTTFF